MVQAVSSLEIDTLFEADGLPSRSVCTAPQHSAPPSGEPSCESAESTRKDESSLDKNDFDRGESTDFSRTVSPALQHASPVSRVSETSTRMGESTPASGLCQTSTRMDESTLNQKDFACDKSTEPKVPQSRAAQASLRPVTNKISHSTSTRARVVTMEDYAC